MNINEIATIVSMLGFPICMCGALCFYIYKVQSKLTDIITQNTKSLDKLITKLEIMLKNERNTK